MIISVTNYKFGDLIIQWYMWGKVRNITRNIDLNSGCLEKLQTKLFFVYILKGEITKGKLNRKNVARVNHVIQNPIILTLSPLASGRIRLLNINISQMFLAFLSSCNLYKDKSTLSFLQRKYIYIRPWKFKIGANRLNKWVKN